MRHFVVVLMWQDLDCLFASSINLSRNVVDAEDADENEMLAAEESVDIVVHSNENI